MTIYEQLKQANVSLDHHESDLYAEVTPKSAAIINSYEFKTNVTKFVAQGTNELWYDIPFAFDPWWDKRFKQNRSATQ